MNSKFLTSLETRIENRRSFYGRFQLGPFDCGQGLTIANAFRRTLLSECSGLNIIVIQLEGACHEYSTIPGIKESVLEILLNLKQIVLTTCPVFNLNTNLNSIVKEVDDIKSISNFSNVTSSDRRFHSVPCTDNSNKIVSSTNEKTEKKVKNRVFFSKTKNSITNCDDPNITFKNSDNVNSNLRVSKNYFREPARTIKEESKYIKSENEKYWYEKADELSFRNEDSSSVNTVHQSWLGPIPTSYPEEISNLNSVQVGSKDNLCSGSTSHNQETKNKWNILNSLEFKQNITLNTNIETTWSKIGYINVKGPKIVRARDIKLPEPLRCVDPNQYIATLTSDGKLNIKLLICKGKNLIVENLLPIHFNQHWFFNSNWFSKQKTALNPLTFFLLRNTNTDRNKIENKVENKVPAKLRSTKNKQIESQLITNRQLILGWQQRKQYSSKKLINNKKLNIKQNSIFNANFPLSESKIKTDKNKFNLSCDYSSETPAELLFRNEDSSSVNTVHQSWLGPIPTSSPEEISNLNSVQVGSKDNLYSGHISQSQEKTINSKKNKNSLFKKSSEYKSLIDSNFITDKILEKQVKLISNTRPLIIDSVFLPVKKTNYSVELDETFNFKKERIILEIWTNGSIHPRKALSIAAKRLVQFFYPFIN